MKKRRFRMSGLRERQALGRALRSLRGGDARSSGHRTQREVADALGIAGKNPLATVSQMETGRQRLPLFEIFLIAAAYKTDAERLIAAFRDELGKEKVKKRA